MTNTFRETFSSIKDPRIDRTKKHSLLDIICLSLCGIIAGCESFEEVSDFGKAHENWFRGFKVTNCVGDLNLTQFTVS